MKRARRRLPTTPVNPDAVLFLQWASETGAHGMPVPEELERVGWHRLAEHPLFHGTWLMETPEPLVTRRVTAPGRARIRSVRPR